MSKPKNKTAVTLGACDFLKNHNSPLVIDDNRGKKVQITINDIGYDSMYKQMWMNPTTYGGLRLTDFGDMIIRVMGLPSHDTEIKMDAGKYMNLLRRMAALLTTPYYIYAKSAFFFRVYDDEAATMISLYGSLNEYLDSLENNPWEKK